ncbi:MAG: 4Fe-4S binding protein [Lachnospiraceae bacterium]|nr:4Fe-4S binding protein [Lachnospiraceae bacterium]
MSKQSLRLRIQIIAALVQNANFKGFFTGKIYKGNTKSVCVPGLNCYSCPGAVGACPIGSLQNFLSSRTFKFPYYVVGLLIFFGALLGRAVCGFLCPFGLIQELIHKIPFPKKKISAFPGDKQLRYLKYAILLIFVITLPIIFKLTPTFCKFICPAGTLEGGLPIVLLHGNENNLQTGFLFGWKLGVLIVCLIACLFIYRPFCKYLCPLGAIYGLLNPVSLYRMHLDTASCTHCGACARTCPMQVDPAKKPNSTECIRCGKCTEACPSHALHLGIR